MYNYFINFKCADLCFDIMIFKIYPGIFYDCDKTSGKENTYFLFGVT